MLAPAPGWFVVPARVNDKVPAPAATTTIAAAIAMTGDLGWRATRAPILEAWAATCLPSRPTLNTPFRRPWHDTLRSAVYGTTVSLGRIRTMCPPQGPVFAADVTATEPAGLPHGQPLGTWNGTGMPSSRPAAWIASDVTLWV